MFLLLPYATHGSEFSMASTNGPITPTDAQIDERAKRVVFLGLTALEEMLSPAGAPMNYDKLSAVSAAVQAGTEAMLPPPDSKDDNEDFD